MKRYKTILLLSVVPLFLSNGFFKKTYRVEDKCRYISTQFRDYNHSINSGNLSEYEVVITYTGYSTLYGSIDYCQIRKNGKVVLRGMLSGNENAGPDDPILYTGVLQLSIDMDICSIMRVNGDDKWCSMTVTGSGPVKTELELDASAGYGYIKISYNSNLGKFQKSVVGTCDHIQLVEEENMVPDKTIASIFNGKELRMLTNRTLRVGRYVETDGGVETVVEVLRVLKP
jgi:hypothetical protein